MFNRRCKQATSRRPGLVRALAGSQPFCQSGWRGSGSEKQAWTALAAVALSACVLQAQEALRSTLSLDRATAPRQNELVTPPPDQPHVGQVQFALGAYSSVEFNDNIYLGENHPQADTLLHVGATTSFVWPVSPQSELRFGAGVGFVHYLKTSAYDGVEIAPDSALTWNLLFPDGGITFYDQFSYDRRVVTESALSGTVQFPRLDNTVGARVNWSPGHWLAEAGYGHDSFLTTSSVYQYLNRSSEYLFARGGRQFAENTRAGLEVSGSFTAYDVALQSDNYSISAGPYADWRITQTLHASLRGGWTVYQFEARSPSTPSSELDSYYFGVELSHQLTQFLNHNLSLRREVRQGVLQGSDYVEQITATYSLNWALTGRLTVGGSLTYENGDQPLPEQVLVLVPVEGGYVLRDEVFKRTETFDRVGAGLSLDWRLREKLSASVGYQRWVRDSNLVGLGYAQNSISLRLNYSF